MGRSLLLALIALTSFSQALPPGDKSTRTPEQQKIDSQLLTEIKRATSGGKRPAAETLVRLDRRQRALVDVRAAITPELKQHVARLGGTIVSTAPEVDSLIAWIPLLKLEQLAGNSSVRSIQPAAMATHK